MQNNTFSDDHALEELAVLLRQCQQTIAHAQKVLSKLEGGEEVKEVDFSDAHFRVDSYPNGEEVIEGVFNGRDMIGPDAHVYPVPENYASKSKLIEGDALKLTITPQGRFIYKQINPAARETKRGVLMHHEHDDTYYVLADGVEYEVLKASVSYYKGDRGDEAVIIVPVSKKSRWAALEAIVKDKALDAPDAVFTGENPFEQPLPTLPTPPSSAADDAKENELDVLPLDDLSLDTKPQQKKAMLEEI